MEIIILVAAAIVSIAAVTTLFVVIMGLPMILDIAVAFAIAHLKPPSI